MQCSGCNGLFGSNGEPEAEVDNCEVSDTTITAEVTVNIPCGNCGSEFKTGGITLEQDFAEQHDPDCEIEDESRNPIEIVTLASDADRFNALAESQRTFDVTETDVVVDEDSRPKTKTRALRDGTVRVRNVPDRFRRHYYDVTVTCSVRCDACGGDFEVVLNDSLAASELEQA